MHSWFFFFCNSMAAPGAHSAVCPLCPKIRMKSVAELLLSPSLPSCISSACIATLGTPQLWSESVPHQWMQAVVLIGNNLKRKRSVSVIGCREVSTMILVLFRERNSRWSRNWGNLLASIAVCVPSIPIYRAQVTNPCFVYFPHLSIQNELYLKLI